MTHKITRQVSRMRDLKALREIVRAAKTRIDDLLQIRYEERVDKAWDKFSWLQKGMMVYIHINPERTRYKAFKQLYGVPLRVVDVHPRLKEVYVAIMHPKIKVNLKYRLPALACQRLQLSPEPTPEALASVL